MLIEVALPLSLAFIMFSLGYGLTPADFGRVFSMPKAVLAGIFLQVIAVPVVAFLALMVFELPPALAFGVMLLSFCPGGVTSNILTKLVGGTVALSITLTAIVSLLSVLTVPLLIIWAAGRYLGEAAPEVDVTSIGISMFAITAVPVAIGLLVRFLKADFAIRTEKTVSLIATLLFVVIVAVALISNWPLFIASIGQLGPVLIGLNLLLLLLGMCSAALLGLKGSDGLCISIEMGVQNAALGIAVAGLVAQTGGIPEYAIPAAVYGITMYIVTIPGMFLLRAVFPKG
ncbi:sodium bile acid symporter family protein [Roseobacter sp. MED193]|uniref:bile acid:sodium symporter family protein n=1 Tax=Roseobacter sp. MED193 TaxID=314262 RepID=UPI000068B835|nr:bile acid:sodium symporter family protein [Roseobacter sp. MED193]EAQ47093.1 sodium bile acid symporter family protein [Roseobacter sp. MED193]